MTFLPGRCPVCCIINRRRFEREWEKARLLTAETFGEAADTFLDRGFVQRSIAEQKALALGRGVEVGCCRVEANAPRFGAPDDGLDAAALFEPDQHVDAGIRTGDFDGVTEVSLECGQKRLATCAVASTRAPQVLFELSRSRNSASASCSRAGAWRSASHFAFANAGTSAAGSDKKPMRIAGNNTLENVPI